MKLEEVEGGETRGVARKLMVEVKCGNVGVMGSKGVCEDLKEKVRWVEVRGFWGEEGCAVFRGAGEMRKRSGMESKGGVADLRSRFEIGRMR